MAKLAFYKAPGNWQDKLIRWGTMSEYSHVELIGPDGLGWSASVREGTVRRIPIDFWDGNWDVLEVPWADTREIAANMLPEMGKKYDMFGIVASHVLSANRSSQDKWFCSEVIAHCMGFAVPHEFSPGTLYRQCKYINQIMEGGSDG